MQVLKSEHLRTCLKEESGIKVHDTMHPLRRMTCKCGPDPESGSRQQPRQRNVTSSMILRQLKIDTFSTISRIIEINSSNRQTI